MKRRISAYNIVLTSLVLLFPAWRSLCCETGSSATVTNVPGAPAASYQVFAINPKGQFTGFFYIFGQQPQHAFLSAPNAVTDLGTLGGSSSEGHSINASGNIVGKAALAGDLQSHAFLFNGGPGLIDLGTLGGASSDATAINDMGTIVGNSDLSGSTGSSGFIYSNGIMSALGTLGGNYSKASALNNAGQVAGESRLANGDVHAFLYSGGILSDLGTFGGTYSSAFAICDSGMVVGEAALESSDVHGFVLTGGVMTDLGTLGGTYSSAYLVNSNGQVSGVATTAGDIELHGLFYSSGVLTDLGTLGGIYTVPTAMNNLGQIVGESLTSDGNFHAFLWQSGKLLDLNAILPVNSGWELVEALYINDSGRIIGVGNFGGVSQWFILDLTTGNNPPVAVAGSNQTVDCQSQVSLDGSGSSDPNGDTLSFEWSVGGNVLGTTPVIAVSLPLGTNVVTLKVSDPCGAYSKTNVTVIVVDNTPPTGSCPASATVSADSNCQAALPDFTRQVVATDNCTPSQSIAITQSPAAGTLLGLGQHPVTVTVTDGSGNSSVCTVLFTVVDKTAPTILSVPSTFTLSAGANCQAQVPSILADVAASDSCTPANQLIKSQNPAAGTLVGLGDQNIVVTVSDAAGNSATADVHFKVADTTAPSILSAPSSVKISADGSCQGVVPNILSNILAVDNCTPVNQLVLTQNPAPGTVLAHGVYSLSITASDLAGNSSSVSVPLEIADTTAPVIECLTATPNVLTPPNHQLVSVSVSAQVADNCDSAPAIKIISITCNEVSAPGDMQITGAMTAMLAASKASTGNARIYTITVQATDSAGNSSTSSVIVTVPKNGSSTLSNSIRHSRVQINSTRPLNA